MSRFLLCVFIIFPINVVFGGGSLCDNSLPVITEPKTLSCSTQILGKDGQNVDSDICKIQVYPANDQACKLMKFGSLKPNTKVGGVTLKPHIISMLHNRNINPYTLNHTVLNITFSNIKWTTMRFRFQYMHGNQRNHCRTINISNSTQLDERSVLYYDCYWPKTTERADQSHVLDFEAEGSGVVNRGQYHFNAPTAGMLSTAVKEEDWKPFMYIEIFPDTPSMRLHVLPPPPRLNITAYKVTVMKDSEGTPTELATRVIELHNQTDDVIYDYNAWSTFGLLYFSVRPLHAACERDDACERGGACERDGARCSDSDSPKIEIHRHEKTHTMNICIASVTALVVATLFGYYIALRFIRRYWCKDYKLAANEIPQPTKVLVIYSPANRLHAECVMSFVTYLRTEYGFDILHDGDITGTAHGDPYVWAEEAFRLCSHVMYIVGPKDEHNHSIYDKPIITAHKDVDTLLLSFVKASRVSRNSKEILNVFFEHSNGQIPIETRHDKVFFLLKDWQKLVAFLSKNLLPKRQIMRTEKGRSFLEDLTRAKKMMGIHIKPDDIVFKSDKVTDKKILL